MHKLMTCALYTIIKYKNKPTQVNFRYLSQKWGDQVSNKANVVCKFIVTHVICSEKTRIEHQKTTFKSKWVCAIPRQNAKKCLKMQPAEQKVNARLEIKDSVLHFTFSSLFKNNVLLFSLKPPGICLLWVTIKYAKIEFGT